MFRTVGVRATPKARFHMRLAMVIAKRGFWRVRHPVGELAAQVFRVLHFALAVFLVFLMSLLISA